MSALRLQKQFSPVIFFFVQSYRTGDRERYGNHFTMSYTAQILEKENELAIVCHIDQPMMIGVSSHEGPMSP